MVNGEGVCAVNGCVALAAPDACYCAVHARVTRRVKGDVAIHCYACGEPIRAGRQWSIGVEGALHLRLACLLTPSTKWWIPVGQHPRYRSRHLGRWWPRVPTTTAAPPSTEGATVWPT